MGAVVEKYFNTKGLSEYIVTPEQTIRRWVLNNEIPYYRIHGVIRYRMSDIDKWIEEHRDKLPADLDSKQAKELFNETEPSAEAERRGSPPAPTEAPESAEGMAE